MNNTLKYVKLLEASGIAREQAEAHVQVITEITEGDLATKQDVKNLEVKLDVSVERLEHKMLQSEYRIVIKLGTIVTIAIAAAATVIKFL
ncbi:MAG: hypothetical protein AB7F59_03845 [Bdellovibrionales bacterium]